MDAKEIGVVCSCDSIEGCARDDKDGAVDEEGEGEE